MRRYKLLLSMTLSALEQEINSYVTENSSAELVNVFFAQGTGFIAALEYEMDESTAPVRKQSAKTGRSTKSKMK